MNEDTNSNNAEAVGLTAEEAIQAILARRRPDRPIYTFIGEVSYGGNLFGIRSEEEEGLIRHLEEITKTDEYFPDRYVLGEYGVIPWTIENGRELAIMGVVEGYLGMLIDYRVEDREEVWNRLELKRSLPIREAMARIEAGDTSLLGDTVYRLDPETGEEIVVETRPKGQPPETASASLPLND